MSKVETKETAALTVQRLDPQALIRTAIEQGSGIETLERLFALAKDVRAEQAREAWNEAMSTFQRTCPKIIKDEAAHISTKGGGSYSYKYAALDGLMNTILPVMGPLGLSVSWRNRVEAGKVIANCRVSHDLGHFEESGEVAMPVDEASGFGASPPQRVGIAMTYAKRYSLLSIVGLAPESDPDAPAGDGKVVEMPKRASESPTPPAANLPPGVGVWTGTIAHVTERTGETKGKKWTLYTVTGSDGTEFSSFDLAHAEFCRVAGTSPTRIEWEVTVKGGKRILSVDPHEEGELPL